MPARSSMARMISHSSTSDVATNSPSMISATKRDVSAKWHGCARRMAIAIPHRSLHDDAQSGVPCASMRSPHVGSAASPTTSLVIVVTKRADVVVAVLNESGSDARDREKRHTRYGSDHLNPRAPRPAPCSACVRRLPQPRCSQEFAAFLVQPTTAVAYRLRLEDPSRGRAALLAAG